tara:strand:- start:332 stop:634 length:303 start_codon:yes stop_codon:yes gene_type:complete
MTKSKFQKGETMTKQEQLARDDWLRRDEAEAQESLGKIEGIEAYAQATDQQKGVIAFGMTPVELLPVMSDYGAKVGHPAYQKGFTLGLMTAAKMNGGMRV